MKLYNHSLKNPFSGLLDVWTEKCDPLKVNNNFINEVNCGLLDVWKKDHKIVQIVSDIQKVSSAILLKIKIYSFAMKTKIKNLFQQTVDPKLYYRDLKEIVHKGKAQRELDREGSASNILHRERQLKNQIPTDQDTILEDLPNFITKIETINFRLKRFGSD